MNVQYSLCDEKILNPKHGIDPIVERLIDLLPQSASIFDVGAGEGRNSIPLVRAGYRVSVADKNLIRLRSDAILQNISLQYYEGDITTHVFDQDYDAFVCMRVLHFLSPEDAYQLLQSMKRVTNTGGCHAITFFTNETIHDKKWFFPSAEEIRNVYIDWNMIEISSPKISKPAPSTNGREMVSVSCLFQKI